MRNKTSRVLSALAVAAGLAAAAAWGQIPGLQNQDVGFPGLPGSTTFAGGKYTVTGGGNDIWGASDNFHYAYIKVTGDFDYIVKVESLTRNSTNGTDDGWSKAELMAREAVDDGFGGLFPDGSDRHISNMTTRSDGQNEVGLQWRSDLRGSGSAWPNDIGITTPVYRPTYPNTWLRLERVGSKFWGYASTDGVTWTELRGSPYDFLALNGNETALRQDGNMANVLALGMAVTAHADADTSSAVFSGFARWTPVPIQITTQPPATVNVSANATLTITAAATGDPVHYQWRRNGDDIPGATSATYTKPLVQTTDSGTYTVRCYGAGQTEVISTATEVTVTVDNTPPQVVRAAALATFTNVRVQFSEPVTAPTATTTSNYQITGLAVTAAALSADGFSVTLTTARQAEGTDYTLTINNVQDTAGNAIAANTTAVFKSFSFLVGNVVMEQWNDVAPVTSLATFIQHRIGYRAAPETPTLADTVSVQPAFETPSWENGSNYGGRLYGWFMPPSTGDYVFYSTSDDASFLYLSSDENPANKRQIAAEPTWENQRAWRGNIRRDASDNGRGTAGAYMNQSDQWLDTEWGSPDISAPAPSFQWTIRLTQGQRYYIEGLWKEGGGGDGFGANYRLVTEDEATTIADNTATRITGNLIGAYVDTSTLPPTITSPTALSGITLNQGASATLSVTANNPAPGALTYQWQLNGRDIAGANSADYVIASAKVTDMGQYWCIVSNPNGSVRSLPANVLVNATGVFAIEAEDFDYDRGMAKDEASVMPYLGGAYEGLSAIWGVDYSNDDNPANNQTGEPPHPLYRYGGDLSSADPARNASMGNEIPGGQYASTRAGEWTMTANYKIGWIGTGNWGNYTRTFPTPAKTYYVYAAQSNDSQAAGALNSNIGLVTAGVGTDTQTVEPLGNFDAYGTGGWSRNNLVAMTDSSGAIKTIEIGGKHTIRWNYNSGDVDYLIFIPVGETGGVGSASISLSNGNVTIAEVPPGSAIVQSAPSVNGPWTNLGAAPQSVATTGAAMYFRLAQP